MNSVALVFLACFVVFAAGFGNTSLTKVSSSFLSTRDAASDEKVIQDFFLNCPAALTNLQTCLAENNYNPDPVTGEDICKMGLLELDCQATAVTATTCPGQQDVIDAIARMRDIVELFCALLSDIIVIEDFFLSCPAAVTNAQTCLIENNYNPNPVSNDDVCKMALLQFDCQASAVTASTCPGQQEIVEAIARSRISMEIFCAALGSSGNSVVTGFFMVIIMTGVNLLR